MGIVRANNLNFGYGEKLILKNINFSVPEASIVSLIGPNGSGKSTLLRCLAGILKTPKKSVFINGQAIEEFKTRMLAQNLAFLPQFQESVSGISVYDLVAMGREPYRKSGWIYSSEDKEKIQWAMDYMALSEFKNKPVNALSGGERQRVWIALTLAQDAPVILLDEPVTYMDLRYQQDLLSVIEDLKTSYKKTIITVFHDINHAMEVSDLVYMLKDGEIYKKGPAEEVLTEQSISHVYNVSAHVCDVKKCYRKVIVPQGCKYKKGRGMKK